MTMASAVTLGMFFLKSSENPWRNQNPSASPLEAMTAIRIAEQPHWQASPVM